MNGSSNHLRATSAYHPTGDIRWPMSVIALITSALPLKADVAAVGCESPKLTHLGHCASFRQTDAASVIIDRDTEEADGAVVTSPVDLQENRKQLAAWFEGAEAIYLERGVASLTDICARVRRSEPHEKA